MSADKFNYFNVFTVDSNDFADHEADLGFHTAGLLLVNRGGSTVEYSFDGTNVHGELGTSSPEDSLVFHNRMVDKVFLRAASGSNAVRVEAWGSSGR